MKIRLSKHFLNQFLFSLCVIIPTFNNYELSFMIWFGVAVLTLKLNYSTDFVKYISIFVTLLFLAIVCGTFFDYTLYYVIRDITYMLKPILGLMIGYQLYKNSITKPFLFLVNAGVAMAIIHLFQVAFGIFIMGAANVRDIRGYGGFFNDFEVYALIFLLFSKEFNLGLDPKKRRNFLIIMAISSFFYLARTNFLQFIILAMALKGYLVWNKKALIIISSLVVFTLASYTAIYYYNPVRNGKGLDEFLYKIKMAPGEAFSTKINRDDWKDFNDNYRSYENIRTTQQLLHSDTWIFGEGIGSQVDLKQKVFLGDMELRHISILHNGYMTVLLKTGIIGLSIYLISIFWFFRKEKTTRINQKTLQLLFLGTGVFLILSNWVFMGMYNLLDSKSLLVGFLFAYKHHLNQQPETI